MAAFVDVADVEDRIGDLSDTAVLAAQSAIVGASAIIKGYTRQRIELVTNDVVVLRGNWTNRLQLPQRPVIAINAVTILNGSVFVDEVPLRFRTDYRWDRLGLVRRVSYVTGRLLAPASGFWGGDMAVVEVNYNHGYAVIPDEIREVCIALAVRRMTNPSGEDSESIGNYSVTHSAAARELTDNEKEMLNPFRGPRRQVGTLQT